MLITTPDPQTHKVEDYDFTFSSGQSMSITVDKVAGDSVDFDTHPTTVRVKLTSKPNPNNPQVTLPEAEVTIFLSHVFSIEKRFREVTLPTLDQQAQWRKVIMEMSSKTVN